MSRASEEITKGLTSDILRDIIDYPSNQNIKVDGITWFKEDSYKGTDYDWLSSVFEKTGVLWERYDENGAAKDLEYPTQMMLGWTAGVYRYFASSTEKNL